jgi:hypothetical protein
MKVLPLWVLSLLALVSGCSAHETESRRDRFPSLDGKMAAIVDTASVSSGRMRSRLAVETASDGFWVAPLVANGPMEVEWLTFGPEVVLSMRNFDFGAHIYSFRGNRVAAYDPCELTIKLSTTLKCAQPTDVKNFGEAEESERYGLDLAESLPPLLQP